MEIHAPEARIETWKDVVQHLAIITAGVLIALALEGMVSWSEHRMLVHEAVANLTAEIRNNKSDLEAMLRGLGHEREELEQADDVAGLLLAGKAIENRSLSLDSTSAELKNAAVTTGEITGPFGYMDYGDVRRFASVYDLQAQFLRLQERESQHFEDVLAFARRIPQKETPKESIERWRSQIDVALAGFLTRQQIGQQLQKRYEELLATQ